MKRNALRRMARGLVLGCAIAVCTAGVATSTASAYPSTLFCNDHSLLLHGYGQTGDRCTQHYYSLIGVSGRNIYGYAFCVAIKPNSDGSGGDIEWSAKCFQNYDESLMWGYIGVYAHNDYATLINYQGAGHTGFEGRGSYTG